MSSEKSFHTSSYAISENNPSVQIRRSMKTRQTRRPHVHLMIAPFEMLSFNIAEIKLS